MEDMAKEFVNTTCPSENKIENDPSAFWDNGPHFDDCYEAFVLAAFFALLTQYVEDSPEESKEMLDNAAKKSCPFPLCYYRYRPTSESFSNIVKWGILQYVALIPIITFATLITEAFGVYCAESMSLVFAKVYLKTAQVICVTIAMYALDFIAVTIKVWDIARQRRTTRKTSEKDRFSLHRAFTSRRKHKYKNLETSSKNLDIEKSSKNLDSET
ncbi:1363_t:CDS:2 [Racocetra fulgida]|uniref:1363_t:CDS:1 n=1 Tax=Racocetra fulgida TaxID=60492 RepID=A0A9N9GN29_9GLOM|nr:1363_t:CDS:2 [Racocetra fulgida]